jgi:hypothetical protein
MSNFKNGRACSCLWQTDVRGAAFCAQASRCPKLFVSGVDDFGNSDKMRYIGGERIERVSEREETTRKRVEEVSRTRRRAFANDRPTAGRKLMKRGSAFGYSADG